MMMIGFGQSAAADVDAWGDAARGTTPTVTASYVFARDITNQRNLFATSADTPCPSNDAASCVKLMTARILLNYFSGSMSTTVTVQAGEAGASGTTAQLQENDVITLTDLLHGLLIPSGNDAALCIARYVGDHIYTENGSTGNSGQTRFVEEMNLEATAIGLTNTTFGSPHGIGTSTTMSARDLAKLTYETFGLDSTLRTIGGTQDYTMTITGVNARTYNVEAATSLVKPLQGGVIAAKGGTDTDARAAAVLVEMPDGSEVVIALITILFNSSAEYIRTYDVQAIQYEAMDQFPDLAGTVTDANFANVVFLSGQSAGSPTDESSYARTMTATGATTGTSGAISGSSIHTFDGVDDRIDAPDADELSLGSGDFTIEFFLRGTGNEPNVNNGTNFAALVSKYDTTSSQREWSVQWDNNVRRMLIYTSTTGGNFPDTMGRVFAGADVDVFFNGALRHVAAVRSSGVVRIYVNGEESTDTTDLTTDSLFAGTAKLMMGGRQSGGTGVQYPSAVELTEVRVTKGVARYAPGSNFLPVVKKFPRS